MPLRPRQGEQEGLGLLNPELADRLVLYTGGISGEVRGETVVRAGDPLPPAG